MHVSFDESQFHFFSLKQKRDLLLRLREGSFFAHLEVVELLQVCSPRVSGTFFYHGFLYANFAFETYWIVYQIT